MLFGGRAFGGPTGGFGGSGIGLFDLLIIGGLIYFGFKFFKRRGGGGPNYEEPRQENYPQYQYGEQPTYSAGQNDVERGLEEITRFDPSFRVESFKETVEDIFFRIQAAWMNRSLEGVESLLTREMADYFSSEFARMRQQGRINRLENIAVRKVEPSEVWQESGADFITVLFTANLLDYTVDESGKVIEGDKLNPVKFQEFWTFSRDIGGRQWQLAGINQPGEPSPR
jgi:predicted lipid-binding transport protein (Tim44 family)